MLKILSTIKAEMIFIQVKFVTLLLGFVANLKRFQSYPSSTLCKNLIKVGSVMVSIINSQSLMVS